VCLPRDYRTSKICSSDLSNQKFNYSVSVFSFRDRCMSSIPEMASSNNPSTNYVLLLIDRCADSPQSAALLVPAEDLRRPQRLCLWIKSERLTSLFFPGFFTPLLYNKRPASMLESPEPPCFQTVFNRTCMLHGPFW